MSPPEGSSLSSESLMSADSQVPHLVVSSDVDIQASQSDVSPEGSIPVMCPAVLTQQLIHREIGQLPIVTVHD